MIEQYISYIKTLFPEKSKIVVAMSGGVDSSLTAALIKRAGFETIGVTLELYKSNVTKGKTCCAGVDIQDAKSVAAAENFPHYVLDYTEIFKEKVIDNFVKTYEEGKTPIPCGRCNQYIKFGHMLDFCKKIEADFLVTGHYIEKKQDKNGKEALFRSKDKNKDQSYFLALTTTEQMKMLNFPLATIEKTIVKELSAEINLVTAKKRESQDICFIPDGDYKKFLYKLRPEMFTPGEIKTRNGEVLGKHTGLAEYTVGQRKNLKLSNGPWYVLELNMSENALIIGKFEELEETAFEVEEVNLLVEESYFTKQIEVQVRARATPSLATFDPKTNIVKLKEKQCAIAPGQICAFYDEDQLIGGSIIKQKLTI